MTQPSLLEEAEETPAACPCQKAWPDVGLWILLLEFLKWGWQEGPLGHHITRLTVGHQPTVPCVTGPLGSVHSQLLETLEQCMSHFMFVILKYLLSGVYICPPVQHFIFLLIYSHCIL